MFSKEPYCDCLKLADQIAYKGLTINPPCICCARMSEQKVVECRHVPTSKKYSNYVYSGRKYKQDFYPQEKWAKLDKARDKVNAEIATMDDELSSFEKELWERQEELFKIYKKMLKNQMDILRVLKKHS
jgi:hypothetical protein